MGSMFAVAAVWIALGALATTVYVALWPSPEAEPVVTLMPWTYALSITFAAGVLWGLRKRGADEPGVAGQRMQAFVAIGLNAVAVTILLIAANGIVYGLAGLAVEIGFLAICWWLYTRVIAPEPPEARGAESAERR